MKQVTANLIFLKKRFEESEYTDYVDENGRKRDMCADFAEACEEAAKTGEMDVLLQLIDFFDDAIDDEFGGVLESLESTVQCNFASDQIIEAFYKKFDSFMGKNLWRCIHICWNSLFVEETFEKFREMFNSVKSKHSENFLKEMCEWAPEGEDQINILKNDMEKWEE
jgi:hypothetical protein